MDDYALVIECKRGLGMQTAPGPFDGVLTQKVRAVKSFMRRAGVSEETLASDDVVGVIVLGVGDIWNQGAGGVKFSPVFTSMVTQFTHG